MELNRVKARTQAKHQRHDKADKAYLANLFLLAISVTDSQSWLRYTDTNYEILILTVFYLIGLETFFTGFDKTKTAKMANTVDCYAFSRHLVLAKRGK